MASQGPYRQHMQYCFEIDSDVIRLCKARVNCNMLAWLPMRTAAFWIGIWIAFAALAVVSTAHAAPVKIIVNTASHAGTSAALAFDFANGGLPANSVTISGFATDGTLGTNSFTGDAAGAFPGVVTLGNSSFFSEYRQNLTLGSSLTFVFYTTGNPANPATFPDQLSLFLLDATTGLPLDTTSDPTSANALFAFDVGEADPLRIFSVNTATGTLDVALDVDTSIAATKYDALTDGLLILRYMAGLTGPALTNGALGATATRTDPAGIVAFLDPIRGALDIDGNGTVDVATDGLLLIRYLFGLRGSALISGAVGVGATRTSAPDIEAYIQTLLP